MTVLTLLSKIVTGRRRLVIKLIMYTLHDYFCMFVRLCKQTYKCMYVHVHCKMYMLICCSAQRKIFIVC